MSTMRLTTSTLSRALPALLVAAVVSIVLGIVGMHALNTHSAGNADHASMTSPMTGSHAAVAADLVTSDAAGPGAAVPDGGDGPGMGSVVMLCFAMLSATAGALLLLGMRRLPRVWAHLTTAGTAAIRWVIARLGTGPPPVWEFSVIRC